MRLFGMKYISPIRYMGTKLLANAFYSTLNSRRMPRVPDICRAQPIARDVRPPASYSYRKSPLYVPAPKPAMPIRESSWVPAKMKSEYRPPAVKRNGGLRGSTATRWR